MFSKLKIEEILFMGLNNIFESPIIKTLFSDDKQKFPFMIVNIAVLSTLLKTVLDSLLTIVRK